MPVNLEQAGRGQVGRDRSQLTEALWVVVEALLVSNSMQPSSRIRRSALSLFGAKIGKGVILRPRLRVKYPWNLSVGARSWIGEGVWIHNQAEVIIGNDVVISQETFITTGSHDLADMRLVVTPVVVEDGAWLTCRCVVLRGVTVGRDSVVTPASVVSRDLPAGGIYTGNPAVLVRPRQVPA